MGDRNYVGQSPPRREDPGLVAGAHSYVADLTAQGCLDAVFVRSFEAHGLLNAVDVSAAEGVEGVVGAYGSDQLPDLPDTPLPPNASLPPEMSWPALARERVRYAGQPLAVVVASDRYVAEDGAELVLADIDPLDAVVDPGRASTDEVQLFEGHSNVVSVREFGSPVDEVMNAAPVVVETDDPQRASVPDLDRDARNPGGSRRRRHHRSRLTPGPPAIARSPGARVRHGRRARSG